MGNDGRADEWIEARSDDGDVVSAGRQREGVVSGGIRSGVGMGKCRRLVGVYVDDSVGDNGSGGIGDDADQGSGGAWALSGQKRIGNRTDTE